MDNILREALERARPYIVNVIEADNATFNKRDLETVDCALAVLKSAEASEPVAWAKVEKHFEDIEQLAAHMPVSHQLSAVLGHVRELRALYTRPANEAERIAALEEARLACIEVSKTVRGSGMQVSKARTGNREKNPNIHRSGEKEIGALACVQAIGELIARSTLKGEPKL